ncbi:MAG: exodeoxyribonuclease VII large subunit, partial [Anaerolineales bacterium]|nr:exodeoxyribonuclease VII large subunit [Anaerolineales bacterium]
MTAVTLHIRQLLEQDDALRDLQVLGEVSNWKRAASGHIYFRLKDSGATITAVMWRNAAQAQSWLPREGDQVVAHGYVGVYPENGAYQLYVNRLQPAGKGQLYARFEALKEKLAAEGLFDEERKRPVTSLPRRIGVVTSADAAALRDILRVLSARWPLVDVVIFSTLVQGAEAPARIVAAIETANRYSRDVEPIDTLLVARGGGSIEDLWAFNDEGVARAIAASAIPTISGVGHEVDFTIADFVADVRAPTPSAAAAGAVPD